MNKFNLLSNSNPTICLPGEIESSVFTRLFLVVLCPLQPQPSVLGWVKPNMVCCFGTPVNWKLRQLKPVTPGYCCARQHDYHILLCWYQITLYRNTQINQSKSSRSFLPPPIRVVDVNFTHSCWPGPLQFYALPQHKTLQILWYKVYTITNLSRLG